MNRARGFEPETSDFAVRHSTNSTTGWVQIDTNSDQHSQNIVTMDTMCTSLSNVYTTEFSYVCYFEICLKFMYFKPLVFFKLQEKKFHRDDDVTCQHDAAYLQVTPSAE